MLTRSHAPSQSVCWGEARLWGAGGQTPTVEVRDRASLTRRTHSDAFSTAVTVRAHLLGVVDQAVHHVGQNSHPLGNGSVTTTTACATFVDMSNPWPTSDGLFGHQLVLVQLVDIRWEAVGESRQAVGLQCHGE
jgi:hypothetical protein